MDKKKNKEIIDVIEGEDDGKEHFELRVSIYKLMKKICLEFGYGDYDDKDYTKPVFFEMNGEDLYADEYYTSVQIDDDDVDDINELRRIYNQLKRKYDELEEATKDGRQELWSKAKEIFK